jgi:hypothetical protein
MTPLLLALLFLPLVLLATLRMTRLLTTDWLGEWLIVGPLKNWAVRSSTEILSAFGTIEAKQALDKGIERKELLDMQLDWRAKLVKGFDCPFCVGYWIGAVLLVITACVVLWPVEWVAVSWALFLGTFALNYIVGHVGSRID